MKVRCYRSPQEAIDELNRELNVRSRCFPRWIDDGRVSRTDAQDRLDRLATGLKLLEKVFEDDQQEQLARYVEEFNAAGHQVPVKNGLDSQKPF